MAANRYLVSFDARNTFHRFTDVLVIGAGIAGLRAALEVPADLSVLVVTKDRVTESNSTYAQGGIAGVLSPEDRFENHIEDTLVAGDGLCDRDVVEMVVREAPARRSRSSSTGARSSTRRTAQLALTREGGHSHRRIVHALGDATGFEVMRAIIARARTAPNVTLWDDTFTLDLLTHDGALRRRCGGAHGMGKLLVWAKQTILASGGCGMVYRETTNPPVATGDGMAAAYRAGAELRDMEFMQFHPTVLYVAGSAASSSARRSAAKGRTCATRTASASCPTSTRAPSWPRATSSPRPSSARWSGRSTRTSTSTCRTSTRRMVLHRFPGIDQVCRSFGLDITKDRIPVRPGAHYMIGGVTVDQQRPDDAARPVGRRRGDVERAARREPAGVEQPARGAGVRHAVRPRRGRGRSRCPARRCTPTRSARPSRHPTSPTGSTWPT